MVSSTNSSNAAHVGHNFGVFVSTGILNCFRHCGHCQIRFLRCTFFIKIVPGVKRERRTKTAPATPTKGPNEQYSADAPIPGAIGPSTTSLDQEPNGSGWWFCRKQIPDAFASLQIVNAVTIGPRFFIYFKELPHQVGFEWIPTMASLNVNCTAR